MKAFSKTAHVYKALYLLATAIQSGTRAQALEALKTTRNLGIFANKKGWQAGFEKLQKTMETENPQFTIFAEGNSKLPFMAFSTLPGVTCPGAGECLDFCYSFRAWRYPSAFMRQAQNAWLMRHNRYAIVQAFEALSDKAIDFRLYVDGDFSSIADLHFWMTLIKNASKVRAYGYSKSFALLLGYDTAGHEWPTNYQLNISSGHNASPAMVQYVKALPIVRGEFIAVSIGRKVRAQDHGKPETNKALREAFGNKAFPCPGKCGSCTGKGHACGMATLKGLPIVIAMH